MNVIAQKSLAEAFGMSRDELSEMLMKQEAITTYGSKAAELNREQLEYMKEHNLSADQMLDKVNNQRSVQEKFNDAMLKLQEIVGNLVAGPLGRFVSFLAEGLDYVSAIAVVFGTIYAYQKGMALYQGAMAIMKGKELAVQIGIAAAWAVANPFTALAGLAIAGGVASLVASQMSAAPKFASGGIVTSEINNATIGEAGPEAIIPLNSPKANSMMGGMDLTPMINAINEVRTAVNALANRPINSVLNIDGRAIGTAVGRQMETGTSQNIHTGYQIA
jgi:exonuclease VII small subunit